MLMERMTTARQHPSLIDLRAVCCFLCSNRLVYQLFIDFGVIAYVLSSISVNADADHDGGQPPEEARPGLEPQRARAQVTCAKDKQNERANS